MGIRLALGGTPQSVRTMIVRDGGRLAAGGIVLGCAGAIAATRFLQSLLFEVSATEPIVFAGAAALLTIVAVTASWIPAHAATKVDPLDAVRRT
jgi:ABC-type antimicrobial peptide transport system permease subunit